MTPKQRVKNECKELNEKIEGLEAFMRSERIHELNENSKKLLIEQLDIMDEYANILVQRLNEWEA